MVVQVNQAPRELIEDLEEVVTWPEGEDGVQRANVAAPGGEVEIVRVAICREPVLRLGFGELPFVNGKMSGEPRCRIRWFN